jgi:uncharacterized phiE125 gp8 family phage protein
MRTSSSLTKVDRFRYSLQRLGQPAFEAVSLDQAKRNCRLDTADHDETIAELISEARRYCEERTDVCLIATPWEMTIDKFPERDWLYLPKWPAVSVQSVIYTDVADVSQTLDANTLVLRKDDHGRGRLARKDFQDWPQVRHTPDAVKIRYTAGWTSPVDVPEPWRRAILMLVAWWFEQAEAGIVGQAANKVPIGAEDLIDAAATIDDFGDFDLDEC